MQPDLIMIVVVFNLISYKKCKQRLKLVRLYQCDRLADFKLETGVGTGIE